MYQKNDYSVYVDSKTLPRGYQVTTEYPMMVTLDSNVKEVNFGIRKQVIIKGYIYGSKLKRTLLSGIKVVLDNKESVTTDEGGDFEFKAEPGEHTISVIPTTIPINYSLLGEKIKKKVNLENGETEMDFVFLPVTVLKVNVYMIDLQKKTTVFAKNSEVTYSYMKKDDNAELEKKIGKTDNNGLLIIKDLEEGQLEFNSPLLRKPVIVNIGDKPEEMSIELELFKDNSVKNKKPKKNSVSENPEDKGNITTFNIEDDEIIDKNANIDETEKTDVISSDKKDDKALDSNVSTVPKELIPDETEKTDVISSDRKDKKALDSNVSIVPKELIPDETEKTDVISSDKKDKKALDSNISILPKELVPNKTEKTNVISSDKKDNKALDSSISIVPIEPKKVTNTDSSISIVPAQTNLVSDKTDDKNLDSKTSLNSSVPLGLTLKKIDENSFIVLSGIKFSDEALARKAITKFQKYIKENNVAKINLELHQENEQFTFKYKVWSENKPDSYFIGTGKKLEKAWGEVK